MLIAETQIQAWMLIAETVKYSAQALIAETLTVKYNVWVLVEETLATMKQCMSSKADKPAK